MNIILYCSVNTKGKYDSKNTFEKKMQMVSCQRNANKAKYFKCSAHKKQQIKHLEHLSYAHHK